MPSTYAIDSKIFPSSDGTDVYAEAVGDHAKPHIIFVHGYAHCGDAFDRIFLDKRYQDAFYLVRYDLRGHGRSGKPETEEQYISSLFADDFTAVLRAFNLDKPIFVGWSYGGAIVADIATHLPPSTLSGVVYIGSLLGLSRMREVTTPVARECTNTLFSPRSTADAVQKATVLLSDCIFDMPPECRVPGSSEERWAIKNTWMGYSLNLTSILRICILSRKQDLHALFEMGRQGFPALVIHGRHDGIVHADKAIEEAKKCFTNLKIALMEKGGNHAPFYEDPDEVMKYITEFLESVHTKTKARKALPRL